MCSNSSLLLSAAEVSALAALFDGRLFKIGGEWSWLLNPLAAGTIYYFWAKSEARAMLRARIEPTVNRLVSEPLPPAPQSDPISTSGVVSRPPLGQPTFGRELPYAPHVGERLAVGSDFRYL